jgi:hypothetical protein
MLLTIYAKSAKDDIPSHILRKIAEELDHDQQEGHFRTRCRSQYRRGAAAGHSRRQGRQDRRQVSGGCHVEAGPTRPC